jgi:hypothetical protein
VCGQVQPASAAADEREPLIRLHRDHEEANVWFCALAGPHLAGQANMLTLVIVARFALLTLGCVTALIMPHKAAAFSVADTLQQVSPAPLPPDLTAPAGGFYCKVPRKCSPTK